MQKNYILPLIILMLLIVPIVSAMDAVNVINPPGSGVGNTTIVYNITNINSEMNQTPNMTPGQSATIVINSTTTLAAGTSAFVTNIGTALNAIWDIGIPQGSQGIQGENGSAGYTPVFGVDYFNGTDGTNGTNGTNGSAATVAANYTFTLPTGSQATVTNVGTSSAASFDFGIPQGAKGDKGDTGTIPDSDQFAFLNGTRTITGVWNFGGYNISNVLDPVAAQDAATKKYVDDNAGSNYNASYVDADGSVAMTGNLSLGTKNINNLAEPSASTDAATKSYVDTSIGYTRYSYYTLGFQGLTHTAANSTNYYYGNRPISPPTTAGQSKVYIPTNGKIEWAEVYEYSGTAGTAEAQSFYIRKNNAMDTLIQTVTANTNERIYSNSTLSLDVAAGDYIELKQTTGLFVTKPATVITGGYILINTTVQTGSSGYTLQVQALTTTPTDAQTVYFGNLPKAPTTTAQISKIYIPKTGYITRAEIYCYSGTAGTAEAWSLYVRKNGAADTLIDTVANSATERIFRNASWNLAVSAGDYIEIKGIQPTWVTNPATTIYGGYVYITE